MALLSQATDDVNGNYPLAGYCVYKGYAENDTDFYNNYYFGFRRYPYSTDKTNKNPLTFKDIDPTKPSGDGRHPHPELPNVPVNPLYAISSDRYESHNVGEVWCVTLWEARKNLINKYGYNAGNNIMLFLVTDGMKLCPDNPNFIMARDAILQADAVNYCSANFVALRDAFSKRGMGWGASAPDSSTTVGVVESFDNGWLIEPEPCEPPYDE